MVAAYKRAAECMVPDGIQVIMFTHQSGSIWADMAKLLGCRKFDALYPRPASHPMCSIFEFQLAA
jgi:hypothetical protein